MDFAKNIHQGCLEGMLLWVLLVLEWPSWRGEFENYKKKWTVPPWPMVFVAVILVFVTFVVLITKEKEMEWDEYTWTVEVKPGIEDKKVGWPFAIHVKADSDSTRFKLELMRMGSIKKAWCFFWCLEGWTAIRFWRFFHNPGPFPSPFWADDSPAFPFGRICGIVPWRVTWGTLFVLIYVLKRWSFFLKGWTRGFVVKSLDYLEFAGFPFPTILIFKHR